MVPVPKKLDIGVPEDANLNDELLQLVHLGPVAVLPDQMPDLEEADESAAQERNT
jgi:hypothetical protein